VSEDTLKAKRKELVGWLRASRKGWADNLADPKVWPPKFADSWYKGTGRTIDNEIYLNTAQKPLIDHPKGIFTMDAEGIAKNVEALNLIGIKATKEMFDTSLLDEI